MKPIVLTTTGDRTTYVNPDHISHFVASGDVPASTYVYLTTAAIITVQESPEQIMSLLADNRSRLRVEDRDGVRA